MDPSYWKREWQAGRTNFHEGKPNDLLVAHVGFLSPPGERRRVLVPLCGKSEDMAFLAAQGHEVVGIELAEEAARAFFAEHGVTPTVQDGSRVRRVSGGPITILVGDLFATTTEDTGEVNALYDRAALVALPPEMRARYVPHVRALLAPGARGIVITVEYDETRLKGPPFSIPPAETRALWAGAEVEALDPTDGRPAVGAKLAAASGVERVFGVVT